MPMHGCRSATDLIGATCHFSGNNTPWKQDAVTGRLDIPAKLIFLIQAKVICSDVSGTLAKSTEEEELCKWRNYSENGKGFHRRFNRWELSPCACVTCNGSRLLKGCESLMEKPSACNRKSAPPSAEF